MAEQDPTNTPPSPAQLLIRRVICPECGSEKGVIAATHYDDVMGFCPSCEQVWGCDVSLS